MAGCYTPFVSIIYKFIELCQDACLEVKRTYNAGEWIKSAGKGKKDEGY